MKKILLPLLFILTVSLNISTVSANESIDLNQADVQTLSHLLGIGKKKAQAIVRYRTVHGSFQNVDEIVKVRGIGKKILEKNRSHLTIKSENKKHVESSSIN